MVPVEGGGGPAENAATLEDWSRALAWLVLGLACAVMVGWLLDVRTLTSVVPGYNTMKFNTAVCLACLSAAVLAGSSPALWVPLTATVVVTTLTLVEIAAGVSLGVDEVLLADTVTVGAVPGRMAPVTAIGLLALALALALVRSPRPRAGQGLLLVPLMISMTALLGYLFDVEQLYRVASLTSVAVHTAAALLLMTVAVGALVPGGLLPWTARGRGPGAAMVRQTTPFIVIGLVTLGLVRMRLGDAGAFGEHFGIAVMVMVGILISVGSTAFAAARLDVAAEARDQAEEQLRALNQSLALGRDEAWARAERLAEDLAAQRTRFDRAISSTESVVWTVETTTGTPVPVYASPNAERVLGDDLRDGETATGALARLVDEDQRDSALEFRRSVRAGRSAEAELRLTVGGVEKWVRIQGIPRQEGDRSFYDGIITDCTDQHTLAVRRDLLLEQEQKQVQKLSELNHLRDEFIAVAGHELRTPVAVILGYCEMLIDPDATDAARSESAAVIARRARQLSDLVERVFDLAKIDSGSMDLNIEAVPTGAFATDLIEEHQHAADLAGVGLTLDAVDTFVLADGPRLQQVFDNLLSNALKYTPTGGHVDLTVSLAGDAVLFEIADDGIGVGAEELPRLFERMFRASSARDAGIPGTGLGLAVTKSLVEAHGGRLTARRNEPHGLVFSVTLPQAGKQLVGSAV
ncbi:MAG: HAMP domain-containing sensor histidine kinase [Propionibacteriales bacterium]|nr:HAMP domain-containing sensor histidine kinase [Propionibacteriales bacterium]